MRVLVECGCDVDHPPFVMVRNNGEISIANPNAIAGNFNREDLPAVLDYLDGWQKQGGKVKRLLLENI